MGFVSGVITGVALAAGAAAWYMSRSGERFRDQYRVERRLGEVGDQLEARTREIQGSMNAQLAEIRAKATEAAEAAEGVGTGPDASPEAHAPARRTRKAAAD
ncbi:MAG: hypothetical protein WEC14_04045 [Chloroflexota bacterium]